MILLKIIDQNAKISDVYVEKLHRLKTMEKYKRKLMNSYKNCTSSRRIFIQEYNWVKYAIRNMTINYQVYRTCSN